MSRFKPATKETAKLRLGIFGPSGSGKTMSSLRIAKGLGGRIAVIDTERGSASKYSDFGFDVAELDKDKSIEATIAAIKDAATDGYDVVIIDSLSHSWQELLGEIDRIAKAKYRGNTWSAWSEGTPKQKSLVDALLSYPGHVIATMRSKTEWAVEKDEKTGKNKPVRIGLAPEAGRNLEYEFDILLELSPENYATFIKDRTGKFQGVILEKPDEQVGKDLAVWLGKVPAAPAENSTQTPTQPPVSERPTPISQAAATRLRTKITGLGITFEHEVDFIESAIGLSPCDTFEELTVEEARGVWEYATSLATKEETKPTKAPYEVWANRDEAEAWAAQTDAFSTAPEITQAFDALEVELENKHALSSLYRRWYSAVMGKVETLKQAA